jgi:hypothetical protein
MPRKDSSVKQRVLAIVFMVILIGSTVAYGIIALFGPKNDYSIPKEKVINYKLNQVQVALLVQNYFTVVEYNYTNGCLECVQVKNYLEELAQNSDGQMYLQEILVDSRPSLHIINAFNETKIENPTPSQAVDAVCNSLLSTPVWCAVNRV